MTDKDKVRSVVARFFNVPEATVTENFVFPPERLHGSVGRATFHAAIKRMAGADLATAFGAATFGELFTPLPVPADSNASGKAEPAMPTVLAPAESTAPADSGVGIDIEHCDNLPAAADPWTEPFYVENFTPAEMAYCQRQPKPRESFCGLWCAKEAVRKCGAEFINLRPLELEIKHDGQGRPWLTVVRGGRQEPKRNCVISISHSHDVSVAVCVATGARGASIAGSELGAASKPGASGSNAPAWLALGLGLLNLLLWLWLVLEKR